MKTTLKSNIFWGLSLSLVLLIFSSVASYISINNLITSSELVTKSNGVIRNLNTVLSILKDAETGQRGFLLTGDQAFLEPYNSSNVQTSDLLRAVTEKGNFDALQQKSILTLKDAIANRKNILDKNLLQRKQFGTVNSADLLTGKKYMDEIRETISDLVSGEQTLLESRTSKLNSLAKLAPSIIIFTALLAIAITLYFYRKLSVDFSKRANLQRQLSQKNEEIETRINSIEKVADQISKGNYKIRLDQITQDGLGSLAGSVNNMATSLQTSFDLLEENEWMQKGVASLNQTMVGEKPVEKLANDLLENIVEFTESQIGALYLVEDGNVLRLVGRYALEGDAKIILRNGEGVAGQCWQSGKPILIEGIMPDEAHTINYASGKTKPRNIIAVPIKKDNTILGVVELGSIHIFSSSQKGFLSNISSNLGIGIYTAQNRRRLQELLEQTQAQAEELQTQQSELEGMNSELEAQSQKLMASEEELRVQQEELMQSNQELEERTQLLEERNLLIQERNFEVQQKSKELEQSSKYKSEFLANMSHELRTPLNSILLLSKLMSESESLEKEYIEYADVIQSSGQGLLSLIDEILDLSKIEAGKMQLELADISIEGVVNDMQSLFQPLAKNKNLTLNIEVMDGTPAVLHTDKMRLEQVLKNLLSNAIKFTPTGDVTLTIKNDATNNRVLFTVKDTGIGIADDKLKLVFEAFQQADGSTRRRFGGTGLGLSISRELAKLLKGEISLTSQEGVGSEFTISIPVHIDQVVNEPENLAFDKSKFSVNVIAETPTPSFVVDHIPGEVADDRNNIGEGDRIILIVEDDTSFAKILLDYTRKKNYKGIVAVRGDEGVELANRFKPLAILLDIQLPVMDGWQVMEALKSNTATRHIPVHIMSSLKVKKESLLKGAIDFIEKPFALKNMQQIFQKLEEALSRHPKKVLIVEENRQHAKALSYFLSANNINTNIEDNVEKSIEALQNHDIDCVILDMGLPDKNAYNTLETIKKTKGLENLPIIVFTGKNLSIGEERRIKKYADSIVVKTAHSYQRILDEAGLFLHIVEENNKNGNNTKPVNPKMKSLINVLENKTVLIADDDVRNIFSLTKALELQQMKVLPAIDGKEALNILNQNPNVDIVLMDMMMPEMDGYETIREIRSKSQFKNTPILAVTAKAMMGDREKCIAVGASDYISKPVDIDQLLSLLRVWLYEKS
ncbi:MAG: response regulator [Ginsengibacter sp.]